MRNKTLIIGAIALVLFVSNSGLSQAQKKTVTPHQVCATADFRVFANQYSNLSAAQQASCFKSSFKYKKNEKIIVSEKDVRTNDRKVTRPFIGEPNELKGGSDHYGYVIHSDGKNKKTLILTEGGTFPFNYVHFAWDGKNWLVTGLTEDEF